MIGTLAFFASYLCLPLFGAAAAFHRELRGFSFPARGAAASAMGAVLLTLEATLFSMIGIRWTVFGLALPLLAVSGLLSAVWARRAPVRSSPDLPVSSSAVLTISAAGVLLLAFAHLTLWLIASRGTSADYVFFWGVKGVRFAEARGIDASLLGAEWFSHATPDYPPLVPVLYAWGVLFSGDLPWRTAPVLAALWWVAALPLLRDLLRQRLSADAANVVTAFWGVALAISLANSFSGGNAEAPLLYFETVAVAALVTERKGEVGIRALASLSLCGAALTKVEGLVGSILIVLGVWARDALERRPRPIRRSLLLLAAPVAGAGAWFAFQLRSGLPVGYRSHGGLFVLHSGYAGRIGTEMIRNLDAGAHGLSWLLPLAFLAAAPKRLRAVLPALTLSAGLLLFFAFDYLHDPTDPAERIGWTLPRVAQPALSAVILAAGMAAFSRRNSEESGILAPGSFPRSVSSPTDPVESSR